MVITCDFFLWKPLLSRVLWARILHNAGFKKKLQITSRQNLMINAQSLGAVQVKSSLPNMSKGERILGDMKLERGGRTCRLNVL